MLCASAPAWGGFEGETIVFGGDAAYPPFQWLERDTARGFEVELGRAISLRGGAEPEHHLGAWSDAMRALESGEIDVLAMFYSEHREQDFLFTPPFYYVNHAIYARPDLPGISTLHELEGRTIAVEELSYAHQQLQADEFPASLLLTADTLAALQAVTDGKADVAILAAPTAHYLIRSRRLPLEQVATPLWPRAYAFAVHRERPELAQWLTLQFYDVLSDGAYQEIYSRWDQYLAPRQEAFLSRALRTAAVPLGLIALLGLTAAWRQRRTVLTRTRRVIGEIKRRRAAESQARWMQDHDAYTTLPRLHHFSSRVEAMLSRCDPASTSAKQVVALKLADLERTILTLGHSAALEAMREFAVRLKSMGFEACGQSGRDVFLVFGDKRQIAEQLRGVVSATDTMVLEGAPIPRLIGGMATWPTHGRTLPELLRRAETALAVAVQKREAWVEYRRTMEPNEADLRLLRLFREKGSSGIHAVFQPQADARTGRIIGVEALVRWNAPEIGEVMPGRFIPLLEDAGLIRHVTSRMLHEAARVSVALRARGITCPISVNVAVADLLTHRFAKMIHKVLREHGAKAEDIKLELTETGVAESPETLRWTITRLRQDGIRTAIDDFGTGYSSLSYLSEFPIEEVKIDRSFINSMVEKPRDRSIVRSTIAMAHELGLVVVAEGVETQTQLQMLRADGCDRIQGYLIGKPMSETALTTFLGRRKDAASAVGARENEGESCSDEAIGHGSLGSSFRAGGSTE